MTEEENTYKISVPLISDNEIRQIDNYLDDVVHQFTEQLVHDKDLAIAQHIIQKQQEEIEKLRNKNKDLLRKLRNRVKEVKKLIKYSAYKKEFSKLNTIIEEKNRIIDLMAERINDETLGDIICKEIHGEEDCGQNLQCKDCIKKYFEKQAKEVKK